MNAKHLTSRSLTRDQNGNISSIQDHALQNDQYKNENGQNFDLKQKDQRDAFTKIQGVKQVPWSALNKLIVLVMMAGLIPTLASTYINLQKGENELFKTKIDHLSSLKEEKKRQIESYFDQIKKQAIIFSSNFTIVSAMEDFTMGLVNAFQESQGKLNADREKKLQNRYRYQVKMTPGADDLDVKGWYPYGKTSRLLQAQYISENKYPIGEKYKLDNAGDGSLYSETHQEYHPYFRRLLETFGFDDIFLVEPETGYIVYSVHKELDYATSLTTGPYSNSAIGKVFKSALKAKGQDTVFITDFEPYTPSYNAPAAFIASPIFSGKKLIGVLIFQVSNEPIDKIITSNHAWKDIGLGESGEVYLIGQDFKLRSNSRFLIENPEEYSKKLRTLNIKPEIIEQSNALKTSIGIYEIKTPSSKAALRGESGFSAFQNDQGVNVLSVYSPLEILGLKWGILAEMDEAEALAVRNELRGTAIISSFLTIVLFYILGMLITGKTNKAIQNTSSI